MVDILNDLDTMGVQRTKINDNFAESLNTDIALDARLDLLEQGVYAEIHGHDNATPQALPALQTMDLVRTAHLTKQIIDMCSRKLVDIK
mgnify:CR=1 FL=1